MEYRLGIPTDMEAFLEHLMTFVRTVVQIEDQNAFREQAQRVLAAHAEDENFLVYLGEAQGVLAVSCLACLYEPVPAPPTPTEKARRCWACAQVDNQMQLRL